MSDQSTHVLDQMFDELPARLDLEFRVVRRGGYDPFEVDAYIEMLRSQIQEMREHTTPDGAVRKRLEEVGDEVAGILQRAHDTASSVRDAAQREAEAIVYEARREADRITERTESRVATLDADTDRIWIERDRIVTDARELAQQLSTLADAAAERFPPAETAVEEADIVLDDEGD